jgi:hypothetical protein
MPVKNEKFSTRNPLYLKNIKEPKLNPIEIHKHNFAFELSICFSINFAIWKSINVVNNNKNTHTGSPHE